MSQVRRESTVAPGSRRLRLLALSATSIIVTFLGLEACVRWFFHDEVDVDALRQQLEGSSVRALIEPSADAALFFELKPNLRAWQGGWVITGAERYRIAPVDPRAVSAAAPAPRYRIAVLGDSTSFGWGVGYEDSYPARYRRRLEEITGAPIELRNYSVPAYNAAQELRTFETKVKQYQPDLILLHHDHNDADATPKMMGAAYMPPEYGDNALHSALIKWTLRRLRQRRNESARAAEEQGHQRVGGYLVAGPLYDAHLDARRALVEQAAAMGIPVVAVLFNAFVTRDETPESAAAYTALHRDLGARLARMGYHVFDLYPRFRSLLAERGWPNMAPLWLSPADAHPNAEGHAVIAEGLVELTRGDAVLAAVFDLPRP